MFTATRRAELQAWPRTLASQLKLGYPVALFLFLRIWTLLWASLILHWLPVSPGRIKAYYSMTPLDGTAWGWLWAPWQRWDTIWYTTIAVHGYSPQDLSTAFFPLYPALIRLVMILSGLNEVAAGLVVSSMAALGVFILFYNLIWIESGDAAARRTLLYLALFPTAFFLVAAYSESLFLFLALAAWWCAKTSRWEYAGVLGGLAALTRPQGLLLVLPLALEFIQQYRRRQVALLRGLNLLTVVGGALVFVVYLFSVTGSPSAWLAIEGLWRQSTLPWEPLWKSVVEIVASGDPALTFMNALDLGLTLLFGGLGLWLVRRGRLVEALYIAIIILPPLFAIARFDIDLPLASISRFVVVAFPGFALLGTLRVREPWPKLVAGLSLLIQTFLLVLFTEWIFAG